LRTPRPRRAGFTLVELVVTMIIIGVLGAFVLPRLSNGADTAGITFADRILGTLRLAQKTAVTHRRLVCVKMEAKAATLTLAKSNGATACDASLNGLDASESATTNADVSATGNNVIGNILYFLPNGEIRRDGVAGNIVTNTITKTNISSSGTVNILVSGRIARSIQIEGATGYVDYLP
jgi:MSHA pilin protein MshC